MLLWEDDLISIVPAFVSGYAVSELETASFYLSLIYNKCYKNVHYKVHK